MKSFKWRILLHTLPVLAALVIVVWAVHSYISGEGGFKPGVDLVGGTILVYEVDPAKGWHSGKSAQDLASSLKRRIVPAVLYNITIRPTSDTRVEIILPTGGKYQVLAAERAWEHLIDQTKAEFGIPADTPITAA